MRVSSEEPPLQPSDIPILPAANPPPSLPASPTPQARSPPSHSAGGSGVPLNFGGVQRQPSVKARDAFTRLRIGSFGASSNTGPSPVAATIDMEHNSAIRRTLSPERQDETAVGDSLLDPRVPSFERERNSSAPPSSSWSTASEGTVSGSRNSRTRDQGAEAGAGMGMSPAASFLSSFSPTSAPTSSSYSKPSSHANGEFGRRVQMNRGGLDLLPPKGNEQGFVLPILPSHFSGRPEDGRLGAELLEEGDWVLGKELGTGGMGVVREVVWRPKSIPAETASKRQRPARIAVKIVSKDMLSGSGSGASVPGSALEAFGFSTKQHLPPTTATQRPPPGSRAASFQLSLPPPSIASLRNPSKERLLSTTFPAGALERNRSTSSPTQPPSNLFPPPPYPAASCGAVGSLSPIEQSPLPSPGLAGSTEPGVSPPLDLDSSPAGNLLLALLKRELNLWSHITAPATGSDAHHPNIVPLLSTFETQDFSYVFMPLCDGGSLLSYLNSPPSVRDDPPLDDLLHDIDESRSQSRNRLSESSKSRSRDRRGGGTTSSLRGRNTLPRVKPRTSLPFASSIASSPSTSLSSSTRTSRFLSPPPLPQERALSLENAGTVFEDLVSGLKWLHEEKGVVHKDLKLENLLSCWEEEQSVEFHVANAGADGMEDERSRSRDSQSRVETGGNSKRWRRVWKIADFGLSEIIPVGSGITSAAGSDKKPSAAVLGVQPLSTLARGGSLSRPHHHHHNPHLSQSLGPSSSGTGALVSDRPRAFHHSSIPVSTSSSGTSESLTAHLHPIGSLPYSSPESLRSPIPILHPSVDVWALGCVLYALVEGVLPFYDEWEFRLRTRLIKGEWETPETLKEVDADTAEEAAEKRGVMEVLRGCLDKNVAERWTIGTIERSEWFNLMRSRKLARKEDSRRQMKSLHELRIATDAEMTDTVLDLPPSPARGRPATARPLLPPPHLSSLSHPSSAASSTPASTSTSRSSSSRSLSRSSANTRGRPSPVSQDSLTISPSQIHPTLRRPSRSTSRSSAYSHQGVDSKTQREELKERGRSQRRLRWEEEKGTSRRRRSQSRDAFEAAALDESALGMTTRGRSSSRSSIIGTGPGKSRERGPGLETVRDEPY
ncbi:hypothetical protein JCM16303_004621 [Sporobolomyces ruberrimus]